MRGNFLVIEGTDGCGKATQVNLLYNHLLKDMEDGIYGVKAPVKKIDFPFYHTDFGKLIKEFWTGKDQRDEKLPEDKREKGRFNHPTQYQPGTGTFLNALDQIQIAPEIFSDLRNGTIVISDRCYESNAGYDGARFPKEQRPNFYNNLKKIFWQMPVPDHTIFLDVPVEVSKILLEERAARDNRPLDFNEKKMDYQREVQNSYLDYYSGKRNFTRIRCATGTTIDTLRPREEIHNEIYSAVNGLLKKHYNVAKEVA